MTETLPPIELDEFLHHAPEKVWRALTTPSLMSQWLMENNFEAVVGHRFSMKGIPVPAVGFTGLVDSEVLVVDPPHVLSISGQDGVNGNALRSTVTWTLVPQGAGTRLFLRHEGFDASDPSQAIAHRIMGGGWRSQVLTRLVTVLEELDA